MVSRSAQRNEQVRVAFALREAGHSWPEIARDLRDLYGRSGLAAMRLAHGWSQSDAAGAWNERWPDDPKTFKNFSYWEIWPGPTGHAPSLAVLDSLAELYECAVSDLLAGWGDHRPADAAVEVAEPETLAWQTLHLNLHELAHAISEWSDRWPEETRRALLLKLSTAAAMTAATGTTDRPGETANRIPLLVDGLWNSTYVYPSTSRNALFTSSHLVALSSEDGRLIGRSRPDGSGSDLEMSLSVEGTLVTGRWTEHTSPSGHYRAATYDGIVQLVLDPTASAMTGMWLGVGKRYTIKSGEWRLERAVQETGSAEPEISATTVPGVTSRSPIF